ncbi:hypothetical protein BGW38_007226 [Lunasporangiospora selenospora]|uniref:Uncharacterized protein n=1 Tax=Lunasporangiospora selenospora TaxID=979761 RepID=A0A9P6FLM8_9FUNG|nr:hypothetical protein BGW38_007226 [Lunasporangiospora selenospora]
MGPQQQQQQQQPQPLVPLKTAILRIAINAAPEILDDLAFAFSRTLTRLCLSFELTPSQASVSQGSDDSFIWKQSSMGDGQPLEWTHLCVGQHWPSLPRLSHLQVVGHGQEQIWLLPGALSPALETVSVIEKQAIEGLEVTADAEAVWITPAKLSRLKRLTLLGTPAVTFHPDTLSSTSELEELVLGTRYRYMDLIEKMCYETGLGDQVDVYWKHEKLWTRHAGWDWRLPQLVHLELEGIFASTFQFQWLDYCPVLKRLYLMTGQDSPRMIQKRDLERNGTLIISHRALEKFKVSGSISIQDEALVLIREILFPSLIDLDVPQTIKTV